MSPPRTIAFMNQKGGVGKTTSAVHLAHALARAGKPTLLVDLDPQGHASLHLGLEPAEDSPTVTDVLAQEAAAADAIIDRGDGLAVLPAETDLAALERDLHDQPDRNSRLRTALESLGDRFECVVLDCPPSLGLLTLNGLAAADEVIIPMQAHFLALQGVSKLLETVQLVRSRLNERLSVRGVILSMHEQHTTLAQEVVADLKQFFDQAQGTDLPWSAASVLEPAIRRNIKLAECPSFGQSIFEYAPTAAGAQDYGQLADNLIRQWSDDAASEAPIVQTPPAAPAETPA